MFNVSQDISLHLGPDSIPNLERGFPQHLHRVQRAGVFAKILPDQENSTEWALKQCERQIRHRYYEQVTKFRVKHSVFQGSEFNSVFFIRPAPSWCHHLTGTAVLSWEAPSWWSTRWWTGLVNPFKGSVVVSSDPFRAFHVIFLPLEYIPTIPPQSASVIVSVSYFSKVKSTRNVLPPPFTQRRAG